MDDAQLHKNRLAFAELLTQFIEPYDCILCDQHTKDFMQTGLIPIAWLDVLFFCVRDAAQFDHACKIMNATQKVCKKNHTPVTCHKERNASQQKRSSSHKSPPDQSDVCHKHSSRSSSKQPTTPVYVNTDVTHDLSHVIARIVSKTCMHVRHSSGYMVNSTHVQEHIRSIFPDHKLILDAQLRTATLYDAHDRRVFVCKLPDHLTKLHIQDNDNTTRA